MWALITERLGRVFRANPAVAALLADTEQAVLDGRLSPTTASEALLTAFGLDSTHRD
jgi:hypothetical protein